MWVMTTSHDTPHDLVARFVDVFNSGGSVAPLYEEGGVVVPVPGHAVGDPMPAVERLRGLGAMTARVRRCYVVGDLALVVVDWAVGELSGTAADVLRRREAGWRYVIDNPHGVA